MKGIWHLIGAKEGDVLLHQGKKDMRKLVKGSELPGIGFSQSDACDRFGDPLWLTLFCSFPALLAHVFHTSLCTLLFFFFL
jgi:hypothetical protein